VVTFTTLGEYSRYKRPFRKSIAVSPGHQTAVERPSILPSTRCRPEFCRSSRGIDACRRDFPANLADRPTATLPLPPGSQPIVVLGWFARCQPNNLACGGPRQGGNREASIDVLFWSR
jgi:hypothetical protein